MFRLWPGHLFLIWLLFFLPFFWFTHTIVYNKHFILCFPLLAFKPFCFIQKEDKVARLHSGNNPPLQTQKHIFYQIIWFLFMCFNSNESWVKMDKRTWYEAEVEFFFLNHRERMLTAAQWCTAVGVHKRFSVSRAWSKVKVLHDRVTACCWISGKLVFYYSWVKLLFWKQLDCKWTCQNSGGGFFSYTMGVAFLTSLTSVKILLIQMLLQQLLQYNVLHIKVWTVWCVICAELCWVSAFQNHLLCDASCIFWILWICQIWTTVALVACLGLWSC